MVTAGFCDNLHECAPGLVAGNVPNISISGVCIILHYIPLLEL